MATTNTIPDHYTIQFDRNWRLAIQQKVSRLREFVTVHTGCSGKARTHNRISSEEMNEQTSRLQTTQGTELTVVKRWVFPRPHEKTTYLDEWDADLLGETVLPTGDAVRVHQAAAARKLDSIILDGINGTNYEGGDNDLGSSGMVAKTKLAVASTYGRDANGYINNTTGGSPAGNLQLQDLIDAKSVLGRNETYGQDQKEMGAKLCCAVNQLALDSLLQETELTSGDYAAVKALVDGEVSYFMGIHFVRTELLPTNDSADGVNVLLWERSHIHFDVWADMSTRISIRDDLSEARQIRSKMMAGACRDEDQAVVWIDCDQTA